jgi:NADPH:quinone reductase-like Zn-dependent oxidoreductase
MSPFLIYFKNPESDPLESAQMTRAALIHNTGGPEQFSIESVDLADPGLGEVLISQQAIGLNYIDVYHRTCACHARDYRDGRLRSG